ncbi:DUF1610 domain-containing protein [bacterium]|nr:DUF1610 domain-containing protein [bacterium]NCT19748.1 DUF1610 domain-containing protein [bacterium]
MNTTNTTNTTGLLGIICPVDDASVAFADCAACAARGGKPCPFPPEVLAAVVQRRPAFQKAPGEDLVISVTELIKCARRTRLEAIHGYYELLGGLYRMQRGTWIHGVLERLATGEAEKRLEWVFRRNGRVVRLTGKPDLVRDGVVYDYKVTENPPRGRRHYACQCGAEVIKLGRARKYTCPNCGEVGQQAIFSTYDAPAPRTSHTWQLRMYALLLAKAGTPVKAGEVIYLGPKEIVRVPVTLDEAATVARIKAQLDLLFADEMPPALADGSDDAWACDYCPLAEVCKQAPPKS